MATEGTKIYGASDDLIEFEGDIDGETGCYESDESPVLVICSDGTLLEIRYGKADQAIWSIVVLSKGKLFDSHTACVDEDETPHSDVVKFKPGLKWSYAATEWEKVR